MSELRISTEKVCFIAAKAKAYAVKVPPVIADDGSNPSDEESAHPVLEDRAGDATEEELRGALQALDAAELADLIGLMWLGRDGGGEEDWDETLRQVADQQPERPVDDLMGTPLLGDYLEEGLAVFGLSCTDSGEAVDATSRFKAV